MKWINFNEMLPKHWQMILIWEDNVLNGHKVGIGCIKNSDIAIKCKKCCIETNHWINYDGPLLEYTYYDSIINERLSLPDVLSKKFYWSLVEDGPLYTAIRRN